MSSDYLSVCSDVITLSLSVIRCNQITCPCPRAGRSAGCCSCPEAAGCSSSGCRSGSRRTGSPRCPGEPVSSGRSAARGTEANSRYFRDWSVKNKVWREVMRTAVTSAKLRSDKRSAVLLNKLLVLPLLFLHHATDPFTLSINNYRWN